MRNSTTIFLDSDGRCLTLDDHVRGGARDFHGIDSARAKYHVRNTGCAIAHVAPNGIRLTLRPSVVRDTVLSNLMFLIADYPNSRFALTALADETDQWMPQVLGDMRAALRYFAALANERAGGDHPIRVSLRAIDDPATKPIMAEAAKLWHSHGHRADQWCGELAGRMFGGTFLGMEVSEANGGNVTAFAVGDGYPRPIKALFMERRQNMSRLFPDKRFEQAYVSHYRHALCVGQPVIADVDAYIFWPERGYVRERYQRLLMPLEDKDTLLSCVSYDSGINLRQEAV